MTDNETLRLDYAETLQQFRMLADIRFKLLAFVPLVSGVALGLLTGSTDAHVRLVTGLFGFLVTLGIIFYELRNSQMYEAVTHRAKALEKELKLLRFMPTEGHGGIFNEGRPAPTKLFGMVTIWHDRGLALVYAPAMGSWGYLVAQALCEVIGWKNFTLYRELSTSHGLALLAAAFVTGLFFWQFHHLDKVRKKAFKSKDQTAAAT
jgi:hypothetical protein